MNQDGRRADGRVYPIEGAVTIPPQSGNASYIGKIITYSELDGRALIQYGLGDNSVGMILQVDASQGPVQSVSLTSTTDEPTVVAASLPNSLSICWGPMFGSYVHTKCKATYVKISNGISGSAAYELVGFSDRQLSGALYNYPKYGIVISGGIVDQPLAFEIQIVV